MRLILALLIALLSLPAVAMPAHVPPPAPAMATHHRDHAPAPEQRHHQADQSCLGCIAPAAVPAPHLATPLAPTAMAPAIAADAGLARQPARPATPPPRAG